MGWKTASGISLVVGAVLATSFILWSDRARQFVWDWGRDGPADFLREPTFFVTRSGQRTDLVNLTAQCYKGADIVEKALYFPAICTTYDSKTCQGHHLRARGGAGYQLPIVHEDLWSDYEKLRLSRFSFLGDMESRSDLGRQVHLLNERLSEGIADLDRGIVTYDTKELAIGYRRQITKVCLGLESISPDADLGDFPGGIQ